MSGQESNAPESKSPSFGEVLKATVSKDPVPVAVESKPESVAAAMQPVVTETKPESTIAVETPVVAKPTEPPALAPTAPGLGFVPVAAVQAERAKRQELEARLREFETQSYAPAIESAPPAQIDTASMERDLRRDLSEQMARKQYSDYDEKVNAFASEVWDSQTGQVKNQRLYEDIINSPLPAEAAYRAGVAALEAKKLGGWEVVNDPSKYRAALEKEISGSLEAKIRAQVEAEFASKAASKANNTITDISQARASGGATTAEYQTPSLSDMLKGVKRR